MRTAQSLAGRDLPASGLHRQDAEFNIYRHVWTRFTFLYVRTGSLTDTPGWVAAFQVDAAERAMIEVIGKVAPVVVNEPGRRMRARV